MNIIQLADVQHLQDGRDLLNRSRFWSDLMRSRAEINQRFGENLLQWTQDVRKKMGNLTQHEKIPHLHQFLETYTKSTELEAKNILDQAQHVTSANGPVHTVKKMTSSKLSSKHENLSLQLDSLTKQHMGTVKTLQHFQETILTKIERNCSLQDRLEKLEEKLKEKVEKADVRGEREIGEKISSLELQLQKQLEREHQHKLQFENLMKEEQHVISKLIQTSDLACQEACDLQHSQIETLVSCLRDFVVKTDVNSASVTSDRRSVLDTLEQVETDMSNIVNRRFDLTCQSYIFPDVQVWQKTFGYLLPVPKSLVRKSENALARSKSQSVNADLEYAMAVWKTLGSTISGRKPWSPKHGGVHINTHSGTTAAAKISDVGTMDVSGRVTSPGTLLPVTLLPTS